MKLFLQPMGLVFAAIAGLGAFIHRPETIVIGIGGYLLSLIVGVIQSTRSQREENPVDQVSNDDRARILPLARLKSEIDEVIANNKDRPVVTTLGAEAQEDASKIVAQAVRLLNIRADLRRARFAQSESDRSAERLKESLKSAQSDTEREMLQSAIDARELQRAQVDKAEQAMNEIDTRLAQAHASLSELKTRLALSAAGESDFDQDEMRDAIGRLQAVSNSFDEAEQVMKGAI